MKRLSIRNILSKQTLPYILIILLLISVFVNAFLIFRSNKLPSHIFSKSTEFGLRNVGRLVTQEGYFTNVQTIDSSRELFGLSIPFTGKKFIYSYGGIVKAGIDFEQISVEVDSLRKAIFIALPQPEIFDVVVDTDSFMIYHEEANIFNPLKLDEINEAQASLEEEVRRTALENGLLESAEANAERLINSVLSGSSELEDYKITITVEGHNED